MDIISKINDSLAIKITLIVSTMWCFYAFCLFSVLPAMFPQWQNQILYISNCLQLTFLPLILVGQSLLGKNAETRAAQDHDTIMTEMSEIKAMHQDLHSMMTVNGIVCVSCGTACISCSEEKSAE